MPATSSSPAAGCTSPGVVCFGHREVVNQTRRNAAGQSSVLNCSSPPPAAPHPPSSVTS